MPLAFKPGPRGMRIPVLEEYPVPEVQAREKVSATGILYGELDEVEDDDGRWVPAPEAECDSDDDELEPGTPAFVAHHRQARSGNLLDTATWVQLRARPLVLALRKRFPHSNQLHDREPGIDSRQLYQERKVLKADCAALTGYAQDAMCALLDFVDGRYAKVEDKRRELPPDTAVYSLLWWHFRPGTEVEAVDSTGQLTAFVVDNWWYDYNGFRAKASFRQWTGDAYQVIWTTLSQSEFRDVRNISDLNFWPLTKERKEVLHRRGTVYAGQYTGIVHANYQGSFYVKSTVGFVPEPGSGRVMIDVASFRRLHPRENIFPDDINRKELKRGLQPPCEALPADELFLLPSYIHAFSLKKKRWGHFLIDRLSPVEWNASAFSHLVIPQEYRSVVQCLVDVHTGALGDKLVADFVKGKGEGVMMSFYGRPGTGKTLTAEAVSDHLHTPLYMVSAGELGTSASALETKLNAVLELATVWKAVLLIDEADIFLQKRTTADIERNALVGIFLRLLEYYNGVLIVTTNRLEEIDEAFSSRFALTLPFHDLDADSRTSIWASFIRRCRPELDTDAALLEAGFDMAELTAAEVNGRVIKQTVRTAQALALSAAVPLQMAHIRRVRQLGM